MQNRRNLLKKSLTTISAFGVGIAAAKASTVCNLTATQPEGPFYPIADQMDKDWDLTKVQSRTNKALGEVVTLSGVVTDENCKPVKGALVEIWQACASGKYNHPGDPNAAPLDPDFQYWGRAITNDEGLYSFKTIKPGSYQATNDWVRPPHIHLKAGLRGYRELITQVYFKEEALLNSRDRLLQNIKPHEQKTLVVEFTKGINEFREGKFNLTLEQLI